MNNHDYHADPRIGSSQLKRILESPAHFMYGIAPSSPAFAFGTAVHSLVLEPDIAPVIVPEFDLRSKSGKANAIGWLLEHGGTVSPDAKADAIRAAALDIPNAMLAADYDAAMWAVESVREHPLACAWLDGALCEQSYFHGQFKARPDATKDGLLIDLKTTSDASYHAFQRQAWNLHYPFSLAHYDAVMANMDNPIHISEWGWIVVESKPDLKIGNGFRHRVECYQPDQQQIDRAWQQHADAVGRLLECQASGKWPRAGQTDEPIILSDPAWAVDGE